jgi:hypothetical protein
LFNAPFVTSHTRSTVAPHGAAQPGDGPLMDGVVGAMWLLLIYRVPQDPPGRRSYVWRQLKQLGSVYLQQAAAILPEQPATAAALEALAERIRGMDGEVSLLRTSSPSREWEHDLVERFNQARNAEYDEIVESVERFEDEIRRETRKGRFTFAELEESETDREKLQRWFKSVVERDFFGAPGRLVAEDAMARGERALHAFTDEVYLRENLEGERTEAPGAEAGATAHLHAHDAQARSARSRRLRAIGGTGHHE